MCSTLQLFLCFVLLYSSVDGYVGLMKPDPKPAKYASEKGCYIKDLDVFIKLHTNIKDNSCQKLTCSSEDLIDIEGCGAILASGDCFRVPGDKRLPFPKCCDSFECLKK